MVLYHRKPPNRMLAHHSHGLFRIVVRAYHDEVLATGFAHARRIRIAAFGDYPHCDVSIGEDAADSAVVFDHDHRSDVVVAHESSRFVDGRRPR